MILGALLLSLIPMVSPVNVKLGPEGEVLAWLASGPFPNIGALELKGTGFATDYLGGEANPAPVEGALVPMIPAEKAADPDLINKRRPGWILGLGSPTFGVDLDALLNGSKPAVAYLYTTLFSPTDQDAQILFGSDDGAKVYVNGQMLFSKQIARGIKRDEDRFPVHLNKGPNRLLFKIEQGNGAWGLLARVADSKGAALKGVTEHLDIQLGLGDRPQRGEKWLRSVAGKGGTFDLMAAVTYDELAPKATRWLGRFRSEATDPDRLQSALQNSAAALQSPSNADSLSHELETADQQIQAAFDHARGLEKTQKAEPLVVTDVAKEDYVKPMAEGRYFVHADGRPFIPIGYNHNPDWPEFIEANPDFRDYRPEETAKYNAHLAESGVNTLRLMIETPPSGNLEDPIGTFSPEHVRWIDTIVDGARKNHIKLIVTPWDTFWMNLRFETTPYNPALGGDLKEKIDFITSPVLRDQEKRRLKFLIDRWGNTGTIFSWELLNEADIWWGASPAQLHDWITDMASYVRGYERKRWGRNHMLSVSFAAPMPKGELAVDAFDMPMLDYATTHLYIGASRAPKEPVGPALTETEGVEYCLSRIRDNRPYMDTENGPIDRWISDATLDDAVFHNMIWAHMASGAAGSGFRWPYRQPHHLTEGMLKSLKAMSVFAADVPWASLAGSRVSLKVSGPEGAATCGFGTATAALVWTSGSGPVSVSWPGGPSHVSLKLFDTSNGQWLSGGSLQPIKGGYKIDLPQGVESITTVLIGV